MRLIAFGKLIKHNLIHELPVLQEERECRCEGPNLLRMPQKLSQMQRLTITTAGMVVLRAVGLKVYADSLQDM
jgi:hypothetical protein